MTTSWRRRGMPARARSRAGSIKPRLEALQPRPNRGTPGVARGTPRREADGARPRSQNSQGTSAQDAFIGGSKVSKVVAWRLFLFFRSLIRDFEL